VTLYFSVSTLKKRQSKLVGSLSSPSMKDLSYDLAQIAELAVAANWVMAPGRRYVSKRCGQGGYLTYMIKVAM